MIFFSPARIDVGIECCNNRTNSNSSLLVGRNPDFFAMRTTPIPIAGIISRRVNVMVTVVRSPSLEFPGPTKKELLLSSQNSYPSTNVYTIISTMEGSNNVLPPTKLPPSTNIIQGIMASLQAERAQVVCLAYIKWK